MIVVEAKLKNETPGQYAKLDEAIRTGQFIRNKCVKHWMQNKGVIRNDLQKLCSVLAKDSSTPWVNKLNSRSLRSLAPIGHGLPFRVSIPIVVKTSKD